MQIWYCSSRRNTQTSGRGYRETQRVTETHKENERETERERERDRDRERQRQRDRQRERGGAYVGAITAAASAIKVRDKGLCASPPAPVESSAAAAAAAAREKLCLALFLLSLSAHRWCVCNPLLMTTPHRPAKRATKLTEKAWLLSSHWCRCCCCCWWCFWCWCCWWYCLLVWWWWGGIICVDRNKTCALFGLIEDQVTPCWINLLILLESVRELGNEQQWGRQWWRKQKTEWVNHEECCRRVRDGRDRASGKSKK